MQHEPAIDLALDRFDLLLVVRRAERDGDERLRLAACKYGRAVHAWQHADFRPDRANLIELAAVETHALLEHLVAKHFFLELLEDRLRFDLALLLRLPGSEPTSSLEHLIDRCRNWPACRASASRRRAESSPSLRPRGRRPGRTPSSGPSRFALPASFARASIVSTMRLMAAWPASRPCTMSSSLTSFAPASTITMASLLPAITRSNELFRRCS